MEMLINLGAFQGIFALPTEVVDQYINEAPHDCLRVLLYIFRHGSGSLSPTQLSDSLGVSESEVLKALDFWQARSLISYKAEYPQQVKAAEQTKAPLPKKVIDSAPQYSAEEITRITAGSEELKFLISTVSERLGKLISPADCSSIIYLYDCAGLPADVILMVVEYCVSIGKSNMRYIEKTALGWIEEGIDTHERAESKILDLEKRRSYEGQVIALMGIANRSLSQAERQSLGRWYGEWGIDIELVRQAYEICVNRTGKLSFSYINSILKAWHEKGLTTPEQAQRESKPQKTAVKASQPSFNVDEYVRLSMKRLHDE